ncbi:hypothetical protein AWB76_03919 [Caballeronia temeraria]|uniref:Uncharacterized protein n=1 Tax=Caballeronia temeraria TaxID=1777137 RepID=A0A158BAH7_9BURK|nr:hypothetical protein AWB76_03919 [Caballeronia temeraria]
MTFRPPKGTVLIVTHVLIGALVAIFAVPAAVEFWGSGRSLDWQRGIAFAVGFVGPNIAEILLRLVDSRGEEVGDGLIDRFFPTRKKDTQ